MNSNFIRSQCSITIHCSSSPISYCSPCWSSASSCSRSSSSSTVVFVFHHNFCYDCVSIITGTLQYSLNGRIKRINSNLKTKRCPSNSSKNRFFLLPRLTPESELVRYDRTGMTLSLLTYLAYKCRLLKFGRFAAEKTSKRRRDTALH